MSKSDFRTARRQLLLGVGALPLMLSGAHAAGTKTDRDRVAAAVEKMRQAVLSGDGKTLVRLVHKDLVYVHSDGHVQSKAQFVDSLAGKNRYQSVQFSVPEITIVGANAIVRHDWDSVPQKPDVPPTHIKVMEVWRKTGRSWQLLARQGYMQS